MKKGQRQGLQQRVLHVFGFGMREVSISGRAVALASAIEFAAHFAGAIEYFLLEGFLKGDNFFK